MLPDAYQEKFVAYVDILGFKELVKHSVTADDIGLIVRKVRLLGSDNDMSLYRESGAEICPYSERLQNDLALHITQVSDCVIVSAELSPAGAINIINYCRKVAERLLLREGVLCRGCITRGKVYHIGNTFFGPAYEEAIEKEKKAAAIEWPDGKLGMPFIEVDHAVLAYLSTSGDECTRQMFPRMVMGEGNCTVISPYGIFARLADWAIDPAKTPDEMHNEIVHAREIIDEIHRMLSRSKPISERVKAILNSSFEKLAEARRHLDATNKMINALRSPFPS